jgi:uncharacterized protein YgbK (DUF1537 family)
MKCVIIADDNTGATDAAGMLTEKGVRTCLVIDSRDMNPLSLKKYDAVVAGTQARSTSVRTAYTRTRNAIRDLSVLRPKMIQIKYCSTFDSTKKGNIGASLDAALDETGAQQIIVCPALPVNGRVTVLGHHFVNGELLSDSPLRNHPLNPMTDANLARWLSYQTKRKTGLADLRDIRKGAASLRKYLQSLEKNGVIYPVADALEQSDIAILMDALGNAKVISGGSGISAEMARVLFGKRASLSFKSRIRKLRPGVAAVSGSMSPATAAQNRHALKNGFTGFKLDPIALLNGTFDRKALLARVEKAIDAGKKPLFYSSSVPSAKVHEEAERLKMSEVRAGIKIGKELAAFAVQLVKNKRIGKLIVSGGETSGTVCDRLGFNVFEVGLPLDPGVPYIFPEADPECLLVLKSGNFGSEDLYSKVSKL